MGGAERPGHAGFGSAPAVVWDLVSHGAKIDTRDDRFGPEISSEAPVARRQLKISLAIENPRA
jgi:hypothetical protein